jgi:hypothetical protein
MSKSFEQWVYFWHALALKLGPFFGAPIVKFMAYLSLYKIFTNGGAEALAYVCYEHMITVGKQQKEKKSNGTQTGVRENKRP